MPGCNGPVQIHPWPDFNGMADALRKAEAERDAARAEAAQWKTIAGQFNAAIDRLPPHIQDVVFVALGRVVDAALAATQAPGGD